jgi:hypothetical protein
MRAYFLISQLKIISKKIIYIFYIFVQNLAINAIQTKTMKKIYLLFLLMAISAVSLFAQQTPSKSPQDAGTSFPSGERFKEANITYTIITAANNTWCYNILLEGRLFIHQPSAPGMPGNEGFKTKEAAAKVAELVISKMKKGEMPPSVTVEEMKNINAL